jgi:membrane protein DedA with SNARE-associated domain
MNLPHLITLFGYPVVLLGTLAEGETVLVLGGFAAHRGYLSLPLVILCAYAGAFLGDQFFFYLGRHKSRSFLQRHPDWKRRVSTVHRYIDRFRILFVLGFRFVYGLRTVSPFVLGMGTIRTVVFIGLDAISALVWATVVGCLGYAFGNVMEVLIGDIQHYEMELFGVLLIVGLVLWLIRKLRTKKEPGKTTAG